MSEKFEQWGILELMGHVRLAGKVTEEELFGQKMGRIDVPSLQRCGCPNGSKEALESPTIECDSCHGSGFKEVWTTQYFGGSSVYRLTPVSEEVARQVARTTQPAPVHSWEFPVPRLAAPTVTAGQQEAEDYERGEDDPLF